MQEQREGWSGVVLAGAPGTGKRTTAFALTTLGRRYERLPALTTARTGTLDIETATAGHLAELRSWAQTLHDVARNGAAHLYDRGRLHGIRDSGRFPVVTLDTTAALDAFTRESPDWLTVLLHGPFDPTRARISLRTDGAGRRDRNRSDRELRRIWDRFTVTVRTDLLTTLEVALLVDRAVQQHDGNLPNP
ncbi:hypothetical protein [Pseudonocardia sp. KRD291]|uniref:hypothetical protein n=1 Tax=Pseudonocardia sp. KRD291 TaxID=2792007 RepID=UPI001C4A5268|nr:hypothetical protein [Pseudonocardia sp. KRD291]MBW0102347.1 hypothetical protein [Pseudonocardia sp. KRD291]